MDIQRKKIPRPVSPAEMRAHFQSGPPKASVSPAAPTQRVFRASAMDMGIRPRRVPGTRLYPEGIPEIRPISSNPNESNPPIRSEDEKEVRPIDRDIHLLQLGKSFQSDHIPVFRTSEYQRTEPDSHETDVGTSLPKAWRDDARKELFRKSLAKLVREHETNPGLTDTETPFVSDRQYDIDIPESPTLARFSMFPKFTFSFAAFSVVILMCVLGSAFLYRGLALKGEILGASSDAYGDMMAAVEKLKERDLDSSEVHFQEAYRSFESASDDLNEWAGVFSDVAEYVPFASKVSSGKHALEAGKSFAAAGEHLNAAIRAVSSLENPFKQGEKVSLAESFRSIIDSLKDARIDIADARESLGRIRLNDLPEDKRSAFATVKNTLPQIEDGLEKIDANSAAFMDMLGVNGPRKYLFLFQNNHEIRPTGGFIGSYGFLDISEGTIRKFFVDGIFDPDGQLKVDIVPPKPIQKVSAGWSLHDSNWFADFPLSARKAIHFYEKTGGPTVDGVIAITPELLKRLLEISGPIELPKYDVVVDSESFMEQIQREVELEYDKDQNEPKQILADLAPVLLEKTLQFQDFNTMIRVLDAFSQSARERHILLYSSDTEIQSLYSTLGWTGEVRTAPMDYLQVVHTNVNGYKTDGVVDETVKHSAKIEPDGSVVNTVTIHRTHKGGDTEHDWFNKVNADFMRVYVPAGSELLSAKGHTREFEKPPLDYDALGFRRDADVEAIEQGTRIDSESGTRIFEESGKTVFGNWVYVSPKESVTVEYVYRLPFRVSKERPDGPDIASYSLLAQKQSGSMGSRFESEILFPKDWKILWKHPDDVGQSPENLKYEGNLRTDGFLSAAFQVE